MPMRARNDAVRSALGYAATLIQTAYASKLGESGRAIRMTGLGPGDFFGEMTLIEV
jgi:hypothetical protein